ncbi:MAG: hypothetical protein KIS94_05015 [Chitinophagales bacterium]|nr:hypothetical protein [Chitinophagales bacterium]
MSTYSRRDDRIIGKIVFSATVTNQSPMLIGKGEGEISDAEVMLIDGKPYIPASSFAGALRSFCKIYGVGTSEQESFNQFWGSEIKKGDKVTYQSHLNLEDLICAKDATLTIRDGVRIDYATGTAEPKGKYDYQLVEPGATFTLYGEVTIRNSMDADYFKKMTATLEDITKHEDFRVGALTSFGFGKLKVNDWKIAVFNFGETGNKTEAKKWFEFLQTKKWDDSGATSNTQKFVINSGKTFRLKAQFKLKSALIIGAYNEDAAKPDKSHLMSNGKPVITAKSIKGALRHRAVKILNTLGLPIDSLNGFMGWVDDKGKSDKAQKSRLRIEESELKGVTAMMQNRIRIDRFTGGLMSGALFNSEPVWRNSEDTFELAFIIRNYQKWEAALLLHLLKDLWTEDLAIGGEKNVGRGILQGQSATITWGSKTATIARDGDSPVKLTGNMKDLKEFNEALTLKHETV